MINVSEIQTCAPGQYKTELQFLVYKTLDGLKIPYERVDTDEVITMEDCAAVDQKLDMKMVKTLFLCTRHEQNYFLFVTAGDKRFNSNVFSKALGVPRVSFAPEEKMSQILGTGIGAATVFSLLLDSARDVQLVMDEDVLKEKYYGCSDGTTTGYMKILTADIVKKFLPTTGHTFLTLRD